MCTYMYAFVICAGRGGVFPKGFFLLSLLMWSALNHYRCLVLHMIELYLFLFLFLFFTLFSLAFLIGGGVNGI